MRRTIRGEFGDIERIVFGSGGSQLVLPHYFSPSGGVSIWNVDSGERVEEIPTGFLYSPTVRPCLSPDGKWLAALARNEGTICIWDRDNLNSAKLPLTLPYSDHGSGMSLTFSPDGHQLIAGFSDGTILGFDVENSWSRFDVDQVPGIRGSGATPGIFDLAFSPNGAVLAATAINSVQLYAAPSYRPLMQLLGCEGVVSSVQFHSKGDRLFVGDLLGNIYTWDFQYASGSLSLPGHAGALRELQFSPNGELLATTGVSDGTVKIWNVKTGDLVRALGKDISGSEMEFTAPAALDFSPDGKLLAIADWKGPVTSLVDVSTGRRIQRLEGFEGMGFVDFHPAGSHLAGCSRYGQVVIWSLGDEKPPVTLDFKTLPLWQRALDLEGGVSLGGITYSPNGNILAVSVTGGPVTILDGKTGQIVNESPFTSETVCRRDIAFSPTEPLIAAGAKDGKLTLWHYQSDEAPKLLTGHQLAIRSLDFSPDGTRLVSGGDDGRLLIWDMETERVMMDLAMEVNTMWGVDFSPDGKSIAVTGDEGEIHILESEPVSDEIARRRLEVALNRD
jgi:WD40 repeat protein